MKPPKIIWVDPEEVYGRQWKISEDSIEYIRADLVEDIKVTLDCIVDRSIRMGDLNCADAQEILNLLEEE